MLWGVHMNRLRLAGATLILGCGLLTSAVAHANEPPETPEAHAAHQAPPAWPERAGEEPPPPLEEPPLPLLDEPVEASEPQDEAGGVVDPSDAPTHLDNGRRTVLPVSPPEPPPPPPIKGRRLLSDTPSEAPPATGPGATSSGRGKPVTFSSLSDIPEAALSAGLMAAGVSLIAGVIFSALSAAAIFTGMYPLMFLAGPFGLVPMGAAALIAAFHVEGDASKRVLGAVAAVGITYVASYFSALITTPLAFGGAILGMFLAPQWTNEAGMVLVGGFIGGFVGLLAGNTISHALSTGIGAAGAVWFFNGEAE